MNFIKSSNDNNAKNYNLYGGRDEVFPSDETMVELSSWGSLDVNSINNTINNFIITRCQQPVWLHNSTVEFLHGAFSSVRVLLTDKSCLPEG